ncbi:FAD-dependent oxidoreductase [Bacillus tianshenii]|nr:FAD-dependent oxidoreductase [Bacillus tianshenii]
MKKLVLVGGGSAHLFVLKQLQQKKLNDVEITFISSDRYQYHSNMFPGFAEGLYSKEEIRIDLKHLADAAGVQWKEGSVLSLDPNGKVILTEQGEVLSYDVISFNIGALTEGFNIPGVAQNSETIRPNYKAIDAIEQVRNEEKLVVVGEGLSSAELSLSLQAWRRKQHINTPVTYIYSSHLIANKKTKTCEKIEAFVRKKGVNIKSNTKVTKVKPQSLETSTNETVPFDNLLWLTEPKAPDLFKLAKLPVDEKGFLLVEKTLQLKKYPSIFGAGDCVTINSEPIVQKNKRVSDKEGPVLYKNLVGYFNTGEGELFEPIEKRASLLSAGDKQGMFFFNGHVFFSRWAWYLKDKLDRSFIDKYQ